MLLYNSSTPKKHFLSSNVEIGTSGSTNTLSNNGKFVCVLGGNTLAISHTSLDVEFLDNLVVGGSTFSYDRFLFNGDIKFKEYGGITYLCVVAKRKSGSVVHTLMKTYRCTDTGITLHNTQNFSDSLAVSNSANVETRAKVIEYTHGFSTFGLTTPNTYIPKESWRMSQSYNAGDIATNYSNYRALKTKTINGVKSFNFNLSLHSSSKRFNYSAESGGGERGFRIKCYSTTTGSLVREFTYVNLYPYLDQQRDKNRPNFTVNANSGGELSETCNLVISFDLDCGRGQDQWRDGEGAGAAHEPGGDGSGGSGGGNSHWYTRSYAILETAYFSGTYVQAPSSNIFDSLSVGKINLISRSLNLSNNSITTDVNDSFSEKLLSQSSQSNIASSTVYDFHNNFKINSLHTSENDFYINRVRNNYFSLILGYQCQFYRVKKESNNYFVFNNHSKSLFINSVFTINDSGRIQIIHKPQAFDSSVGNTTVFDKSFIKTSTPNSSNYINRANQNVFTVYDSVGKNLHYLIDYGTERKKYTYNFDKTVDSDIKMNDSLTNISPSLNRRIIFGNYPITSDFNNPVFTKQLLIGNDLYFYTGNAFNSGKVLFFNSADFENLTSQTFFPKDDIGLFLTKDEFNGNVNNLSINHININSSGNFSALFRTDSNQRNIDIMTVGLDDYEDDFINYNSFGNAESISLIGDRIVMSMDHTVKRYPILNFSIYTELDPRSDYSSRDTFEVKENQNFVNYFNTAGNNIYSKAIYEKDTTLYNLDDITAFYGGNNYIFNVVNKFIGRQKSFTGQILFDLLEVSKLEISNLIYNSCTINFSNDTYNANSSFYIYLFDDKNSFQDAVTSSGIIRGFNQLSTPNSLTRNNRDENLIDFVFAGLDPVTSYKAVVVPYSSFSDFNSLLNLTYDQLMASSYPTTELAFDTIDIPKINVNNIQNIGHDVEVTIDGYDTDPWSKLKYTIHKKNKTWDSSSFEYLSYLDTDLIDENSDGRDLLSITSYRDVEDNVIKIQDVFHDEDLIVIFNFENIWKNSLTFSPTVSGGPSDHFYTDIPFTIGEVKDPNLNFSKYGLVGFVINETKPDYATFKSTTIQPNFTYATFDIENVDIGDIVNLKDGTDLAIKYNLDDIIFYKIHFLKHPQVGEPALPNGFDENNDNYQVSSFIKSVEEFNFFKKSYLENGRLYSYFIEPIFNLDRISTERNQMIWDVLKTPTTPALNHIRNDFNLNELKYVPKTELTLNEVDSESFSLTLPDKNYILGLMGTTADLSDSLQLRIQVFDDLGSRVSTTIKSLDEIASETISVDYLKSQTDYTVLVNVTTSYMDRDPLQTADDTVKLLITTYPEPLSYHNMNLSNAVFTPDNKIIFDFSELSLKTNLEVELYKLNLQNGTKTKTNEVVMVHVSSGKWSIVISPSDINDYTDNAYEFIFYNVDNGLKSNGASYVTAIPQVLKLNQNLSIQEIKSSSVELDLFNLESANHGEFTTYETLILRDYDTGENHSSYAWNYSTLINQPDLFDLPKLFYGLQVDTNYKIIARSRWINEDILKIHFSNLLDSANRYFPTFEYEVDDPFVPTGAEDFRTLFGEISSPVFSRENNGGQIDLDTVFYYVGGHCWIKIGIDDGTGKVDDTQPNDVIEIPSKITSVKPLSTLLANVTTDAFNIVFQVFGDSGLVFEITDRITISEYGSVGDVKRIALNITEQRQVLALDGSFDNKYFFKGYCLPKEATFSVNTTGLDKGLNTQLQYVIYTEPYTNEDNITEDVKVIEFTLDNLGYGITYSSLDQTGEFGSQDEIKVFANTTNASLWQNSYPITLSPFRCKYPLLPAPQLFEQNNQIKDSITFKFYHSDGAFGYRCSLYFKPFGNAEYNTEPITTENINNFNVDGVITYTPHQIIDSEIGDYKLVVTSLNFENEPTVNSVFSTRDIIIKYLDREVICPELKTMLNTSDNFAIFSFDKEDLEQQEDKRSDYIVMTDDLLLGTATDQTTAYGWYEIDLSTFNIFTYYDQLSDGLNSFFYKGYNRSLNMFSDVKSLQIYRDDNNPNSFLPNDIYSTSFAGIDIDGIEEDFRDTKRIVSIHEDFKIKKISYIITNETGVVVSENSTNKNVFESLLDESLQEIYIFIDYEGILLSDGTYRVDFYIHGENDETKYIKSSNLYIDNRTLPIPKIKYQSQNII